MKNSNKKITYSILLIIFISFNTSFTIFSSYFIDNTPLNKFDLDQLNLSAGEITISTPENKTYVEPMRGYYPGTYGFESDYLGTVPSGWDDISGSGNYITVESNKFGHKNVLEGYDNGLEQWDLRNFFTNTEGTIEFWIAHTSTSTDMPAQAIIRDGSSTQLFGVQLNEGNVNIYTIGGWFTIPGLSYSVNTWYHIRLDYRSNSGISYGGLSQNEFAIFLNGLGYGEYSFGNNGDPNHVMLNSRYSSSSYYAYYDAFGFSWDPNYSVGDNFNEGLLLSYDSISTLDWQGYSFNNQPNKTISGNTTITMPNDGTYKIKVFGNTSSGLLHESYVRVFTVATESYPGIALITPEARTYYEPMNSYYPATYGFENENSGSNPTGWTVEELGSQNVEVIEELDGHKKVLEFFDTSEGTTNYARAYNNFSAQTSGTVEWWFRRHGYREHIHLRLWENFSSIPIGLGSISGNFRYNDGTWHDFATCEDDTWYHIRVDFECGAGNYQGLSADTFYVHIDGTRYGPYNFYSPADDLDTLDFLTRGWGTSSDYWGYFDAVGYSWDPNYSLGDNYKEGLLISYINNTELDWIMYSLDGGPNVTITGYKVIPIPEIGLHSIILSGFSEGFVIQSEIRYFSISILEPPPPPYIPTDFPILIPLILASIGIGIAALIGIVIFLTRRRGSHRIPSTVISTKEPQIVEKTIATSDSFKVCPFCFGQMKKTGKFCIHCGAYLTDN